MHGAGYIELGRHYNNWLYKVRSGVFLKRMAATRRNFSNASVLDVGCGTGFYIERWKQLGAGKITGLDITDVAIRTLRRKHPDCAFHQMDIGANIESLGTHKFDVISAFDVLFHIVDDERYERAIHNIYSLLNAGGLFVWSENFLREAPLRGTHQVCRTLYSIENILAATGFEIVERRPIFYLMNAPLDTRNRFIRRLWQIISETVKRSEPAGFIVGGLLYPLELALISLARESPTTEMMICRR